MRGSAVMAASKTTLDDSNPVKGGAARDWIAELVNQFLGRLKLRLLSHKVEIYLATPVVLRGEQLSLEARGSVRPMWFQRPSGDTLGLWLDLDLAKDFTLAEPVAGESQPEDGMMMLL
jgi:CheY-specific phosphatase CheX